MGETPTPGSVKAEAAGCTCPILDNNRGRGWIGQDGEPQFWITTGCPIHNPLPESAKEPKDAD